ncbi:MAG: threonylcarbamoyl-AMP synthase [Proteobacteria bacterium]|nr:threonylcarbamoyl-AMP synthase [Pseudomonadota bacterium]
MSERIEVRLQGPTPRAIEHIVGVLVNGGLIAYPTDSGYALGWRRSDNRKAQERVIRLRQLNRNHPFTYCCRNLSDISQFARLDNWAHRLVRQLTPGPYTFILPAIGKVPRTTQKKQARSIGIRIPDHAIVQAMLNTIDEPILSSSLILPDMEDEIYDAEDLFDAVHGQVDLFVDAGYCPLVPTTLLDLTKGQPKVLRMGQGMIDFQ